VKLYANIQTLEEELLREIQELEASRNQAKAAVDNVLELLKKADERRVQENDRHWDRILDNLERALDLTRARRTTYEQLLKERQRDLEGVRQSGGPDPTDLANGLDSLEERVLVDTLREVLPENVPLPRDHVRVAERILAMPLDVLGNLTLDEVAKLNAQIFEMSEADQQKTPQGAPAMVMKKTWLDDRVAQAKHAREALAATRRSEVSFVEKRRQVQLRNAVEKIVSGNLQRLDLSEIDLITEYSKGLEEKIDKGESDLRMKKILDRNLDKVKERASDLRRRRARFYTRP
jgi:hypothetical protein